MEAADRGLRNPAAWADFGGVQARTNEHDPVNHPKHYTSHPSGVECIQVVEHMTFNVGNAIKYLWRAGLKDAAPQLQDLEKARWYIDREIQRRAKESSDAH